MVICCSGGLTADHQPPILHGMIYGRKSNVLRTFFAARESTKATTNASIMSHRPPILKLPIPAEKIDGHTVTFRPVRDGIDSEVSGVIQVVERANGFNVNASYVVGQDPPQSHVYWFDQSEIDAIARSLFFHQRPGDRIDLRLIEPIDVRLRWILSDDVRSVDVKSARAFDHLDHTRYFRVDSVSHRPERNSLSVDFLSGNWQVH